MSISLNPPKPSKNDLLKKENMELKDRVDVLERFVEPLRKMILDLQADLAFSAKNAATEEEKVLGLERVLDRTKEALDGKDETIRILQEQLAKSVQETHITALSKNIDKLTQHISTVLPGRTEEERRLRQYEVDELSHQKDMVEAFQERLIETEKLASKYSAEISSRGKEIVALKERVTETNRQNRRLERNYEEISRSNRRLASSNDQHHDRVRELTQKNQQLIDDNKTLDALMAGMKKQIQKQKETVKGLEVVQKETGNGEIGKIHKDMLSSISQRDEKIQKLEHKNQELLDHVREMEADSRSRAGGGLIQTSAMLMEEFMRRD